MHLSKADLEFISALASQIAFETTTRHALDDGARDELASDIATAIKVCIEAKLSWIKPARG